MQNAAVRRITRPASNVPVATAMPWGVTAAVAAERARRAAWSAAKSA